MGWWLQHPRSWKVNTLRPRQYGLHFPDDIFKCIFLNENVWISIKISLKFVPKGPINNIPPLVQIMAWRWPGDKPLFEPMMVSLMTHICVTQPQWIKRHWTGLILRKVSCASIWPTLKMALPRQSSLNNRKIELVTTCIAIYNVTRTCCDII